MPYQAVKGNTLLIPSGPVNNPDQLHLHVILTDSCENNRHLLVNISTIRDDAFFDSTCVVEPGEHPSVPKRSWVVYRRAMTLHADYIKKCVDGWSFKPKEVVPKGLFSRICDGVGASNFTPRDMKRYFAANNS